VERCRSLLQTWSVCRLSVVQRAKRVRLAIQQQVVNRRLLKVKDMQGQRYFMPILSTSISIFGAMKKLSLGDARGSSPPTDRLSGAGNTYPMICRGYVSEDCALQVALSFDSEHSAFVVDRLSIDRKKRADGSCAESCADRLNALVRVRPRRVEENSGKRNRVGCCRAGSVHPPSPMPRWAAPLNLSSRAKRSGATCCFFSVHPI
jgi:hypothetical protein